MFLNKQDILREKVDGGKRVEDYFPEFSSYRPPENIDLSQYKEGERRREGERKGEGERERDEREFVCVCVC